MTQRYNDFDFRNEERGKPPRKFEDSELQALLDENDTQSQTQMTEMLNVSQKNNFQPFKRYGKHSKVWKMGDS